MSEEQLIATPCVFGENGNFVLERELGRGGMGGVYMGRDKMLDRPVAVKVMLKEYGSDAEFVEKFKREAQAAARLIHPNIAQIYSYGISDGMPYIAMELVAGGSLDQIMRNSGGKTDVPRVMKICEQVAQALRCAADQGLVHGDVKPENVLLDANGNAKLVDFGLAAMQKDTNEIWGTPYYIAPEKVKKEPVDYRADMYSLGGTIYHALTGVAPFEGDDAAAVVRKRFEGPAKKPSEVRPGLSPQIDFLVMKMLALDPAERYPSFEALLEDYKKVMTTGLSATQPLSPAQAASAGAAAGAGAARKTTVGGGGKKLMLKSKRRMTIKSPGATAADGGADAGDEGAAAPAAPVVSDEDEEENSGSVGAKILLVIGGVIAAIGLVAGLLWFAVARNASNKEKEAAALLDKGFDESLKSLASTKDAAVKLEEQMGERTDALRKTALALNKKIAKEIEDMAPAGVVDAFIPPEPQTLIDARNAYLNPTPPAAPEPAAPAPAASDSPESRPDVAATAGDRDLSREATNPAPAEGQPSEGASPDRPDGAGESPAPEEPEAVEPPAAPLDEAIEYGLKELAKLWDEIYAAEAGVYKRRAELNALVASIDAAAAHGGERTKEALDKIAAMTRTAKADYEEISGSKEWLDLKKLAGENGKVANSKIFKSLRDKLNAKREAMRKAEAAKKAKEADEAKKKAAEEEKARRVEEETAAVKAKFDEVCAGNTFRHLDWKGAKRQLESMKKDLATFEGKEALRREIGKIDRMESVQTIIKRNLKDYVFSSSVPKPKKSLRRMKVAEVDDKKFSVIDKVGAQPRPIRWEVFYRDYDTYLGELCNKFIDKGRENGSPKLTLLQRADALLGVALTMKYMYSDNDSAAKYQLDMIKKALKAMPDRLNLAKEYFPEVDFDAIEQESAAQQL